MNRPGPILRVLADENVPRALVAALRAGGHEVAWVREDAAGADDADVLARAAREGRVLLTFDKDFGELARGAVLPPSCGVILARVPAPRGAEAVARLAGLLSGREDWPGHFAVIEPGRVRLRPLTGRR